nr:hypothetical protein [Tanacetum cinerariifolium]
SDIGGGSGLVRGSVAGSDEARWMARIADLTYINSKRPRVLTLLVDWELSNCHPRLLDPIKMMPIIWGGSPSWKLPHQQKIPKYPLVNDGPSPLTVADHRWPPWLTVVDWFGDRWQIMFGSWFGSDIGGGSGLVRGSVAVSDEARWMARIADLTYINSRRPRVLTLLVDWELSNCHPRIGEDYQEYRLPIPETMLIEAIKQSESYKMFIKYSTVRFPPRRAEAKKKVTLSADNNIISDDPDTVLELGKSISKTKAEKAKAARQVHATHARIVTESVLEPTKRRKSDKVTSNPPKKLKGVLSLTLEEQEAADIMQALKESKKTNKRQPGTRGLSEGTGTIPRVPNKSTVVSTTSNKGTSTKPGVPDKEKDITIENVILEWGSK